MKGVFTIGLLAGVAMAPLTAATADVGDQAAPPPQSATTAPDQPVTAVAPDAAAPDSGEIVVTAQGRSENIQKTSLAVTALTGNDLVQRGVRDLQDLQNVSPSLSFADAGILKFANIRGVGLNLQSPTVVSGVATYRDGLFAPSPIFLNEGLFDIASIEVLRGPQGTFVGQNSTGGAVIQKSISPTLGHSEGNMELTGGNYGEAKLNGGVSIPLSDTLAVRVATQLEHRNSFYNNLGPGGDKAGRVREEHGRISLLWEPSDHFSALLKTELNHGDNGGYPAQPIKGTFYAPLDPPGDFTFNYDRTDTKRKELSSRTSLELNYTLDSGIVFRSISGYQYGRQNFLNDLDATLAPDTFQHQKIEDNVYSEEINIISPDRGRFKWVVGGSFVRQTAGLDLHIYNNVFPFGTIFPIQDVFVNTVNPKNAFGAFAQGTFRITDTLSLEAGGRLSHDTQTQRGFLQLSPTPPLPGVLDATSPRYKDTKLTGKASLNWQVTPRQLLYAFVANGFKSGGVNVPSGTFKPERITDFEGGWKGTLFDGLLRVQVDGFYMDYRDLQLNIFNPLTTQAAVTNAGKSTIYGGEAQAELRRGGFAATANFSYVHSKVGALTLVDTRLLPNGTANGLGPQCPAGTPAGTPSSTCFDYSPYSFDVNGSRNPYSPKFTISGDVRYSFALGGTRTLTPQVNIAYMSSQTTSVFERPVLDYLGERTLVGAQLTYAWRNWSLTAYATNLTDQHYRIGNDTSNNVTYYGAPRQIGGRLGVRF